MFNGTLRVAMSKGDTPTEISVEGTIGTRVVELREVSVLKLGKQSRWNLGSGSGTLQSEGQQMVGTGTDTRTTYKWSFTRQAAAGNTPAPSAAPGPPRSAAAGDLSGTWEGTYAGNPAELTLMITGGSGAFFTGTLRVTTSRGKAPTELSVEVLLKGDAVSLRETRVVAKGATSKWNLGSATGILQPDSRQMSGSGRDSGGSYKWSLTKK